MRMGTKISRSLLLILLPFLMADCKHKIQDDDIRNSVEKALAANPDAVNTRVVVEKGVVYLTGNCKDETSRQHCAEIAAVQPGVVSVVNNCSVPLPPVAPELANAEARQRALTDVLHDEPGLRGRWMNDRIVLAGTISRDRWLRVKQTLDKLYPSGYNLDSLSIKK